MATWAERKEKHQREVQRGIMLERRRYGNRTYTWLNVLVNGSWEECGDPWPSINIAQRDVTKAIGQLWQKLAA